MFNEYITMVFDVLEYLTAGESGYHAAPAASCVLHVCQL